MRVALLVMFVGFSAAAQAAPLIAVLPASSAGSSRDVPAIERSVVRSLSGHPEFEILDPAATRAALRHAKLTPKVRHYLGRAARALDAQLLVTIVISSSQVTVILYGRDEAELIRAKLRHDQKSGNQIAKALYPAWKSTLRTALGSPQSAPAGAATPRMPTPRLAPAAPKPEPEPEAWLPKRPPSDDAPAAPPEPEPAPVPPPAAAPETPPPPPPPLPAPLPPARSTSVPPLPPPAEAVPASTSREVATTPSESSELPVFDLSLSAGALSRSLSYNQDIFGSLGGYTLGAGAALAGSIGFYPVALLYRGFFSNVGLIGSAFHTVGAGSNLSSVNYPTLADRWNAGLRVRVPLDPIELGISVGYGGQEFRFGLPPLSTNPPVPSYTYGLVSSAVDARFNLGKVFAVLVNAGYLYVTSDGVADSGFFPHAKVNGLDAGLTLAFAILGPVELRLGADYQRFFFAMHSAVGDANVAGGAIDQYLESTLGLAVRL